MARCLVRRCIPTARRLNGWYHLDSCYHYNIHRGDELALELTDADGLDGTVYSPELSQRYLYGSAVDEILAVEDATGDVLWGLGDHEGTIRDLVDSTGTVEEHRQYDTFGQIVSPAVPTADFPQAFTGRPLDADTDLYNYRARWYDPAVGRFVSEDPSGFAGGDANLYRYAGNSPLVNADPSGLCFTGVAGLLFPGMDFGGDHRSVPDSASSGPSIGADDRSWLGRWWDKIGYRWSHREPLISDPKAFRDVEINGRHYTIANDQGGWTDWLLGNLYHRLGLGGAVEQILRYEMDPIGESYQQAKGLYDFVTNFHRIPEIWDAMPDYQRQDIAMQLAGTGAGMGAWRVLSLKPTPVYSGGGGTLGTWMSQKSPAPTIVAEVVDAARFGAIERGRLSLKTAESWGRPDTLADHFARHGADFGAPTPDDYARMSTRLLQESQGGGIPTKISPDGVIRVYDPATNTFGSFNPNGTTKTFYKPNPAQHRYPTNLDYWNAQPGASPWKP